MSSGVLLLCCCSNRKLAGGESAYQAEQSLPKKLSAAGRDLLAARQRVVQRVKAGAVSAQGLPLRDLPYNSQLANGPDLGGKAAGLYMPAMRRYRGRFFQELDPEETGLPSAGPHHFLFVSALYGVVAPDEPIQRYSCHTLDDDQIARTWSDGLLTSVLLQYMRVFDVRLIVDLLADVSYRQLFNWERIRRRPVRVLTAFGDQNYGPGLLPALGQLVGGTLASQSAEELLAIDGARTYLTDYEDVVLSSEPEPPAPFLGESSTTATNAGSTRPPETRFSAPEPLAQGAEGCMVLAQGRDVRVTSGGHNTIFGRPITAIRDIPPAARRLFETASRAAEVLDIRLGPFKTRGGSRKFALVVAPPRFGDGTIDGKLTGPAEIGGSQQLRIRVTPGRENATYLALVRLLEDEVG